MQAAPCGPGFRPVAGRQAQTGSAHATGVRGVLRAAARVLLQRVRAVPGRAFNVPIRIIRRIALQAHRDGTADVSTASREIIETRSAECDEAPLVEGCPQSMSSTRDA